MIPPPELILLRSMVKGNAEELRSRLADPATDATGFLRFAYRHQLGAYAYAALRQMELAQLLPRHSRAAAKASSLRERTRIERLVSLLREVAQLIDSAGIEVLFIKGPLLAYRYYGTIEARGISDLDILLRDPDDLPRVEKLLLARGFKPAFRILVSLGLTLRFAHHFEYRQGDLPVDVHWVLQRHFTFALDHERVWATGVRVPMDGHIYHATSDEYELVLQILGVVTDLQVGKLTLRSVVDIYQILKAVNGTLDWSQFLSRREPERILRPSAYVLALALEVLDCRDEFADLASLLESRTRALPPRDLAFRAILRSRPLDVRQKLLALRIYESSLPATLSWWLLSLPFRLSVYGLNRRWFGT